MHRVYVRGLCSYVDSYGAGVMFFTTQIFIFRIFGECTCTFVTHNMVYDILVVDMIVCVMQV